MQRVSILTIAAAGIAVVPLGGQATGAVDGIPAGARAMGAFDAVPAGGQASGAIDGIPSAAQAAAVFDGIPNLTLVFYDVSGADAAAIRAAIDAKRPADPHDPAHAFDAATDWSMRGRWRGDGRGGCALGDARIDFAATVTLPRLSGTTAEAVRQDWDRYIAALARHEAAHARYAYDHRGDVLAAVRSATCATASAAAAAAIERIVAHDRAYDDETRHGETEGAIFP